VDPAEEQQGDILDLHHQEEVEAEAENTEEGVVIQKVDLEAMGEDLIADREITREKGAEVIHPKIAIKNLRAQGLRNDVYYNF
jgi:hypothetical protein